MKHLDNILYVYNQVFTDKIIIDTVKSKYGENIYKILKIMIFHTGRCFLYLFKSSIKQNNYPNIFLYATTANQINSLKPLQNSETDFVNINLRFLLFYKIIYFFPLLFKVIKENKSDKISIYYNALGRFEESKRILKRINPKIVVFANDINASFRAMMYAAKELGIKTYYFQHASVSKYFPPLEFDVSFLEGKDSLCKYKEKGIYGKVELIGMIKFNNKMHIKNIEKKVKTIGVAFNSLDDISLVKHLLSEINKKFKDITIYVRPHPRDMRKYKFDDVLLSNSKHEDSFSFLQKIDLLIASDSSIHLEAALMNVVPVYYLLHNGVYIDYYGYNKHSLNYFAENIELLIKFLEDQQKSKSEVFDKTNFFVEPVSIEERQEIMSRHGLSVNYDWTKK